MPPLPIIIDTREQAPWSFPIGLVTTTRAGLMAGDYALAGDPAFAIERKSLDDYVQTITRSASWDRFRRELDRMRRAGYPALVVVVEGTVDDLSQHRYASPMVKPKFVLKRTAELTMGGVSVLFAGGPEAAAYMGYAVLRERSIQMGPKVVA